MDGMTSTLLSAGRHKHGWWRVSGDLRGSGDPGKLWLEGGAREWWV